MTAFDIHVEGLSKRYQLGALTQSLAPRRITEDIMDILKAPLRRQRSAEKPTIWALRDVSFEVKPGEVVGIIGRNGAGKSTLLKILSRITEPTTGRAVLNGRVASLLEVGTGFHPELTGRENLFLNGAIMGMRREEIRRKFDEIVAFAEVEQFIDTPVKRYSSGMYIRLAFAVAAHLEAEILLVDEVLAVGDAAFQKKCLNKMSDVSKTGRTVLLVSHNMGSIRQLCSRCLWLHQGQMKVDGETGPVIDQYLVETDVLSLQGAATFEEDPEKEAQVRSAYLVNKQGQRVQNFSCDEAVIMEFNYQVYRQSSGMYGVFSVDRIDGAEMMVSYSFDTESDPLESLPPGSYRLQIKIPPRTLGHGTYMIKFSLARGRAGKYLVQDCGIIGTFTLDDFTSAQGNRRRGAFSTLLNWELDTATERTTETISQP